MKNFLNALRKACLFAGAVTLIVGAGGWSNHRTEAIYMMITGAALLGVSLLLLYLKDKKK